MAKRDLDVEYRAPLSTAERELAVCSAAADPAVFAFASRFLGEDAFSGSGHAELDMFWSYCRKNSKGDQPISPAVAIAHLKSSVRSRDDLSVSEKKKSLGNFTQLQTTCDAVTAAKDGQASRQLAMRMVRQLCTEFALSDLRARVDPLSGIVADAELLTRQLSLRLAQINSAVGSDQVFNSFDDLRILALEGTSCESCGITAFDLMLNGGQAAEEVYAMAGPTGSSKTTTAVQMAVSQTKRFDAEYRRAVRAYNRQVRSQPKRKIPRPKRKVAHIFTYEDDRPSMIIRVLACAASIVQETFSSTPTGVLENPSRENLTGSSITDRMSKGRGELKGYERELFSQQISVEGIASVPGELDRFLAAARFLKKHLVLHDMRGGGKSGVGSGGVSELAGCLRTFSIENPDTVVGSVFIDYAKLLIGKQMDAEGKSKADHLRFATSAFPMQVKNQVAEQFKCPVWVLQQLDAAANALKPGRTASRISFPEAKDFLENMNFGFIASAVTADHYVVVDCVKHRRGPHVPKAVLKLRGNMCQIRSAADMVARADGTVISREEAGRVEPVRAGVAAVPMTDGEQEGYIQ